MGRWKGSPQGPYYDPNDTGPDQVAPPPGMGQNGQPLPQQARPQMPQQPPFGQYGYGSEGPGGITGHAQDSGFGQIGWGGGQGMPPVMSESMPDGMGGYRTPGGHFDKDGNLLPAAPMPDMSGWARKQYPGGVGGPIPPWMQDGNGTLASLQPQKDSFGMKSGMDPNMTLGGWGKPTGQMGTFGSLSSLGNTLGSAGGNVLKKLF